MGNPANIGRGPYAERSYLKDTLRMRQGVISQPIISALSGKPVVLITEPVFDRAGKIVAVIGGAIDLGNPHFSGRSACCTQARPAICSRLRKAA